MLIRMFKTDYYPHHTPTINPIQTLQKTGEWGGGGSLPRQSQARLRQQVCSPKQEVFSVKFELYSVLSTTALYHLHCTVVVLSNIALTCS